MDQPCWSGSCFPRQCSLLPSLLKIVVVVWIGNADPSHQCRLNARACAVREIQIADAFRSQEPLVTSAGRNVDKFGFDVQRQNTQRLNNVNYQQRIMRACSSRQPLKVCAKTGRVLDMTDRDDARVPINETNQFIKIDPPFAFLAQSDFYAQRLAQPQPRIDV